MAPSAQRDATAKRRWVGSAHEHLRADPDSRRHAPSDGGVLHAEDGRLVRRLRVAERGEAGPGRRLVGAARHPDRAPGAGPRDGPGALSRARPGVRARRPRGPRGQRLRVPLARRRRVPPVHDGRDALGRAPRARARRRRERTLLRLSPRRLPASHGLLHVQRADGDRLRAEGGRARPQGRRPRLRSAPRRRDGRDPRPARRPLLGPSLHRRGALFAGEPGGGVPRALARDRRRDGGLRRRPLPGRR